MILPHHIFPSLLAIDPLHLGSNIQTLIKLGIQTLHLDIMDGHYVPNLTFGPHVVSAIRQQFPAIVIDVHLMVTPVDACIVQFAKAGAQRIAIHPESTFHLDRSLNLIRESGCQAGIVLNPATDLDCLRWCAECVDFILVMTVNPGFGGQRFIEAMLPKINALHQLYPTIPIAVDGGIHPQNIQAVAQAGASEFIIGSNLFNTDSLQSRLTEFCHPS